MDRKKMNGWLDGWKIYEKKMDGWKDKNNKNRWMVGMVTKYEKKQMDGWMDKKIY